MIERLNEKFGDGYHSMVFWFLDFFYSSKKTFIGEVYQNNKIKFRSKFNLSNFGSSIPIIAKGELMIKDENSTELNIRIEMSKFHYWFIMTFLIIYLVFISIFFLEILLMFVSGEEINIDFMPFLFLTIIIFFISILSLILTKKDVDKMYEKTDVFIKNL